MPEGRTGYLLFSNCAANVIYKWTAPGALSVFLEKSGYTRADILNVGQQTISGGRVAILLIGSNGLTRDLTVATVKRDLRLGVAWLRRFLAGEKRETR